MDITYYDYFRAMVNTKFLRNFDDIACVEHEDMCGTGEEFKRLTRKMVRHGGYESDIDHGPVAFYFKDGAVGYVYEGYAGNAEWKLFDPTKPPTGAPLTDLSTPF